MNIGKTYCGKTIMITEEYIFLTLRLGPQWYHTECFTLNMYYKMQLITAIIVKVSSTDEALIAWWGIQLLVFCVCFAGLFGGSLH